MNLFDALINMRNFPPVSRQGGGGTSEGITGRLAFNTGASMNQTKDFTPLIPLYPVPHDNSCTPQGEEEELVIQLDVIDLAEPDDDY